MTFMLNKIFAIKLTMIMTDIHIYLDLYLDLGLYLYLDLDLQIHLHLYWLQEYDLWFHFDHGCKSRCVYYFPRIHVLCQKFSLNWWFPGKKPWVPPPLPSLPCPTLEFCVKQDTKYQDELVIILTKLQSIQPQIRIHLIDINMIDWYIKISWSCYKYVNRPKVYRSALFKL